VFDKSNTIIKSNARIQIARMHCYANAKLASSMESQFIQYQFLSDKYEKAIKSNNCSVKKLK